MRGSRLPVLHCFFLSPPAMDCRRHCATLFHGASGVRQRADTGKGTSPFFSCTRSFQYVFRTFPKVAFSSPSSSTRFRRTAASSATDSTVLHFARVHDMSTLLPAYGLWGKCSDLSGSWAYGSSSSQHDESLADFPLIVRRCFNFLRVRSIFLPSRGDREDGLLTTTICDGLCAGVVVTGQGSSSTRVLVSIARVMHVSRTSVVDRGYRVLSSRRF